MFNYFVSDINYKTIKYEYNTDYILNSDKELNIIIKYTLIAIGILLLIGLIGTIIFKRNDKKKELKKEDKLKFIDVMTSLKNRNYLNLNIYKWEKGWSLRGFNKL